MIKLVDLIKLAGITLKDFKIHCARGKNPTPLETFLDNSFKQWQEDQKHENFQRNHILSLIHLDSNMWLFGGVYKVDGVKKRDTPGKTPFLYKTTEVGGLDHLVGRAFITFEKKFRASYLMGPKYIDQLEVSEIRSERMSVGEFSGYHSVLLPAKLLRTVIRDSIPSWKAALSSVAGIYVIVDSTTGKQYVGSAYGEGGIWQRWKNYAQTGHGGNKELRDIVKTKGKTHAENFQFAILEVCDVLASTDYILEREVHWKNVLCSREFGLNSN